MKITELQYNKIKELLGKGWTQTRVADKYHLSQATISKIKLSKSFDGYLQSFKGKYRKKPTTKDKSTQARKSSVKKVEKKKSIFQKIKEFFR